jgi:hypothetical protein
MENVTLKIGEIKFRIQPRARADANGGKAVLPVRLGSMFSFDPLSLSAATASTSCARDKVARCISQRVV